MASTSTPPLAPSLAIPAHARDSPATSFGRPSPTADSPCFDRFPARLEVFARLIELLQRARPEFAGKQRMTRHDLRTWMHGARARGSDIKLASHAAAELTPAEVAGEQILQWHLQQRWREPENAWDELLARLVVLLRQ